MKTLILGISLLATGFIGFAILCGAAVTSTFTLNSSNHFMDIWKLFGVTPIAIGFLILGIIGIIVAIAALMQKSK